MSDTCLQAAPATAATAAAARPAFVLEVAGPVEEPIEVSIDGSYYQRGRFSGGAWRFEWRGRLDGNHHMVVVIRAAVRERATEGK